MDSQSQNASQQRLQTFGKNTLRREQLDDKEKECYTVYHTEAQAQMNEYVERRSLWYSYSHVFNLITRMRLAVNHPFLALYHQSVAVRVNEAIPMEEEGPLYCGSNVQSECPSCSKALTVDFTANKDQEDQTPKSELQGFKPASILHRINLQDFRNSTKIDALMEEIRLMVERNGSARAIVISQFTDFLDLINYSLQKSGVSCIQLDGSMNMNERVAVSARFTEDKNCRVLLMAWKVLDVAVRPMVASVSHVFLMEPCFPWVEKQEHNIINGMEGQYGLPIRVVRFLNENTIEERLWNLQEKKKKGCLRGKFGFSLCSYNNL